MELQWFQKARPLEKSSYGCSEDKMHTCSAHSVADSLSLQCLFTDTHLSFVFSASMPVEGSSGSEGDAVLELTEQKTNAMVLDLCHKPGGSKYLQQIYHIMQLNEVGKRPFYRAIRCVLA